MYEGTIFFGRQGAVIQAMSGIEIALWDIVGKATRRPVYQLLGGGFRTKFRAYASILFGDTPTETERTGKKLVDQGYKAVKFGWGPMGQGEASDLAQVRAARQGLGKDAELMVDAGLCWDTATAIRRARQFEAYNLTWLEEPLHPDNLQGYARLCASNPAMRIAAGEEICDVKEFQMLMDTGIDVVQVDVTRVGVWRGPNGSAGIPANVTGSASITPTRPASTSLPRSTSSRPCPTATTSNTASNREPCDRH
jgi:L-rhamnonate dehydratase